MLNWRRLVNFAANLWEAPILVFNYHRIAEVSLDPFGMCVAPKNFDFQIKYLKENDLLITPEQFYTQVENRKFIKKRSVLLTFDDGYQDTVQTALPILQKYGASAIFYISTGRLGTKKEFWWDRWARLSARPSLEQFRTLSLEEKEARLGKLEAETKAAPDINSLSMPLTPNDVFTLSEFSGSMIGAHSHDHAIFAHQKPSDVEVDLKKCKTILEEITHKKILSVAYPHGGPEDFSAENIFTCKKLGFKWAFTNQHGHYHSWSDPYILPRASAGNSEPGVFETRLKKIFRY